MPSPRICGSFKLAMSGFALLGIACLRSFFAPVVAVDVLNQLRGSGDLVSKFICTVIGAMSFRLASSIEIRSLSLRSHI